MLVLGTGQTNYGYGYPAVNYPASVGGNWSVQRGPYVGLGSLPNSGLLLLAGAAVLYFTVLKGKL